MNLYRVMWGELGYSRCHARVMATKASPERKQAALSRAWKRRYRLHYGHTGVPSGQFLARILMCNF